MSLTPNGAILGSAAAPTNGDDIFDIEPGSPEAVLDGGDGDDTLRLNPTADSHGFSITSEFYKNIETIQGSDASEEVWVDPELLGSLAKYDGGGGDKGRMDCNKRGTAPVREPAWCCWCCGLTRPETGEESGQR